MGVVVAEGKVGISHDAAVQGNRGVDALDEEEVERPLHANNGLGTVPAVADKLGDQRVVVGRYEPTRVGRGVNADPNATWH